MALIPHPIYGTLTKLDTSAYEGKVWITNETTNQRVTVDSDSSGKYIYDLANMNEYSNGDVITIGMVAYASKGYLLLKKPFEDTGIDTVDFDGQRLNTATLSVNFKISIGVSINKARVELFKKFYNQLNKDPPTFTDKDSTEQTYEIVSAFPEITPTYPCIIVNPIEKETMRLGVDQRPNVSLPGSIDIDFFAKTKDGKNAIDIARDKVEMIIANNWITGSLTVDTSVEKQLLDIVGVE